jgi:hypothetical protein
MNERAEQTNDVLGKLTVLGTIVLPMNIVTGMWGMNTKVDYINCMSTLSTQANDFHRYLDKTAKILPGSGVSQLVCSLLE